MCYICEHCGREFDTDWRKDAGSKSKEPIPRFCSRSCANTRSFDSKTKEKTSLSLKTFYREHPKRNVEKQNQETILCKKCGKPLNQKNKTELCIDCFNTSGLKKFLLKEVVCSCCKELFLAKKYLSPPFLCTNCSSLVPLIAKKESWETFSVEEVEEKLFNASSREEFLASLGYNMRLSTGAYNYSLSERILKRMIAKFPDLTKLSSFLPQKKKLNAEKTFEELVTQKARKDFLIGKRGYACECCGLSIWNNKKITLELHHIDGNRGNNAEDNLQLLCPNCHSQTDTFKGQRRKNIRKVHFSEEEKEKLKQYIKEHINDSIRSILLSQNFSLSEKNYETVYEIRNSLKYNT